MICIQRWERILILKQDIIHLGYWCTSYLWKIIHKFGQKFTFIIHNLGRLFREILRSSKIQQSIRHDKTKYHIVSIKKLHQSSHSYPMHSTTHPRLLKVETVIWQHNKQNDIKNVVSENFNDYLGHANPHYRDLLGLCSIHILYLPL